MLEVIYALALLLWAGAAIYGVVQSQRKLSRRIRTWASENGYAVIRLQYRHNILRIFGLGVSFLSMGLFTLGSWFVEIQDEQGGIRCGYANFPFGYFFHWVSVPWGKIHIEWR